VLGENHRMLRLLASHTRIIERKIEQGGDDPLPASLPAK